MNEKCLQYLLSSSEILRLGAIDSVPFVVRRELDLLRKRLGDEPIRHVRHAVEQWWNGGLMIYIYYV